MGHRPLMLLAVAAVALACGGAAGPEPSSPIPCAEADAAWRAVLAATELDQVTLPSGPDVPSDTMAALESVSDAAKAASAVAPPLESGDWDTVEARVLRARPLAEQIPWAGDLHASLVAALDQAEGAAQRCR